MTTALRDAIDHTALGWVKPEIDETLRQARLEIEAFAESPGDGERMRACASAGPTRWWFTAWTWPLPVSWSSPAARSAANARRRRAIVAIVATRALSVREKDGGYRKREREWFNVSHARSDICDKLTFIAGQSGE